MRALLESIRERHERVLVIGLGISGIEAARLLLRLGIQVRCVEGKSEAEFGKAGKHLSSVDELKEAGVDLHFGISLDSIEPQLDMVRLVVLSPGVPLTHDVELQLSGRGIEWCGELELGLRLFPGQVITVTGSNGKSTTATLLAKLLECSGVSNRLCGNIGIPIVSVLARGGSLDEPQAANVLVVEASSYQLAGLTDLHVQTHVILNLSENHLERHGSMEGYLAAKASLLAAQADGDFAILNADDPWTAGLIPQVRGHAALFGEDSLGLDAAPIAAAIRYAPADGLNEVVVRWNDEMSRLPTAGIPLIGRHNRMNIAAAALAAHSCGGQIPKMELALQQFKPLEHRLEVIPHHGPGLIINDSKATTVAAVVAALRAVAEEYPNAPLWCLLGGRAKVGSWLPVVTTLKSMLWRIRSIVCFGEDGARIRSTFDASGLPTMLARSLQDAVSEVHTVLSDGEVMLFSPGCASFDAFHDFEERGAVFKSLVAEG